MSVTINTYLQADRISRKRGIIKQVAARMRSLGGIFMVKFFAPFGEFNAAQYNLATLPVRTPAGVPGSALFLP